MSKLIGTSTLNAALLQEIADIIAEHIIVCNYSELAFLVNEFLEDNDLVPIKEKDFVKFLKGVEVPVEIAENPDFILLEKLVKKALITKKKELMEDYLTSQDWKVLKRVEFLMATRFIDFGKEDVAGVQLEGGSNIVINIDNRKIEMVNPITSELQMLDSSEGQVAQYLAKRGLLENED